MVIGKKEYEQILEKLKTLDKLSMGFNVQISEDYDRINKLEQEVKVLQEIIKFVQERGTIEYDDSIMMNKDGLYDYQRYKRIHGGKGVDEE